MASNDSFNEPPLPLNPASAQQLAKVAAETEMLALFSTRYSSSDGWKIMVITFLQEEHSGRRRCAGGRDGGVQESRGQVRPAKSYHIAVTQKQKINLNVLYLGHTKN